MRVNNLLIGLSLKCQSYCSKSICSYSPLPPPIWHSGLCRCDCSNEGCGKNEEQSHGGEMRTAQVHCRVPADYRKSQLESSNELTPGSWKNRSCCRGSEDVLPSFQSSLETLTYWYAEVCKRICTFWPLSQPLFVWKEYCAHLWKRCYWLLHQHLPPSS